MNVGSAKELHAFVWERLELLSKDEPKFLRNQLVDYRRNGIVRLLGVIPMIAAIPFQKVRKFAFLGHQYSDIISALPPDQTALLGGFETSKMARRQLRQFVPVISLSYLLWLDYVTGMRVFLRIGRALLRMYFRRTKPQCLVLAHDLLPLDRLLAVSAKEVGARIFVIAHGLYQSQSPRSIIDGQVADAVFVYDSHQGEIFRSAAAKRIVVMGYHSDIQRRNLNGNRNEVCFLGQPWGKHYGEAFALRYAEVLKKFVAAVTLSGARAFYKPHQLETEFHDTMRSLGLELFSGSLEESFDRFDYLFSVASTALFEATLSGKVAVQTYDPMFKCDRFDEFGYSHVVDVNDAEAIKSFRNLMPISANAMHYGSALQRFKTAIRQTDSAT